VPELPEVETVRRQLEPRLTGRRVTEAWSHPSPKFVPARELVGKRLGAMGRRGKFLINPIDGEHDIELIIHLGMTGQLLCVDQPPNIENQHLRAWWMLDNETTLEFIDVRRFGRIRVVPSGDYDSIPTLANAGPEPFDESFDAADFWQNLRRSRRPIKTQLLSQRPIAGVGNIYADEALWLAQINPKARRLGRQRADRLLTALREVLEGGLANGGTTLRDYRNADGNKGTNQHQLMVYGRSSRACYRCSAILRSEQIDGRTTTWCPDCQGK